LLGKEATALKFACVLRRAVMLDAPLLCDARHGRGGADSGSGAAGGGRGAVDSGRSRIDMCWIRVNTQIPVSAGEPTVAVASPSATSGERGTTSTAAVEAAVAVAPSVA